MGRDALSGEVFIFMNRRRDQVKMLVWDRSGFVIYYKRLERGRFELPAAAGGGKPPTNPVLPLPPPDSTFAPAP
jgi:transposase